MSRRCLLLSTLLLASCQSATEYAATHPESPGAGWSCEIILPCPRGGNVFACGSDTAQALYTIRYPDGTVLYAPCVSAYDCEGAATEILGYCL